MPEASEGCAAFNSRRQTSWLENCGIRHGRQRPNMRIAGETKKWHQQERRRMLHKHQRNSGHTHRHGGAASRRGAGSFSPGKRSEHDFRDHKTPVGRYLRYSHSADITCVHLTKNRSPESRPLSRSVHRTVGGRGGHGEQIAPPALPRPTARQTWKEIAAGKYVEAPSDPFFKYIAFILHVFFCQFCQFCWRHETSEPAEKFNPTRRNLKER